MTRLPRLVVFSGAGLSAESGLPTFRGKEGLWEGVPLAKVCHIDTWRENFQAVHDFYDARRVAEAGAEPNAAHPPVARHRPGVGVQARTIHSLERNLVRQLSSVASRHRGRCRPTGRKQSLAAS